MDKFLKIVGIVVVVWIALSLIGWVIGAVFSGLFWIALVAGGIWAGVAISNKRKQDQLGIDWNAVFKSGSVGLSLGSAYDASTDAINGSQLAATNAALEAITDNSVQYDNPGKTSVTLGGATSNNGGATR